MSSTSKSLYGNIPPSVLNSVPALEPPPGVLPNFLDPEDRGPILLIVCTTLLSFVLIFYTNRMYAKLFIVKRVSWDDCTCSLGLVGAIVYYIGIVWVVRSGLIGKHQWDVTVADITSKNSIIPTYIFVTVAPPTMLFIKVTFFLLYLQVFQPMRWLRISAYMGAITLCAFYGACTVTQFIFATPSRHETWSSHAVSPDEQKLKILSLPTSGVGLFFDIVILILPIAGVIHLQLPTRRKIGIMLIFATGLSACICSLLSIYFRVIANRSPDGTWTLLNVELMMSVEMHLGIICSCMPAFAKTLRHHLPLLKAFSSTLYSHLGGSGFKQSKSKDSYKSGQTQGLSHLPVGVSEHPSDRIFPKPATNDSQIYESSSQPSYELGQLQSVRTFVGTTKGAAASDDKIHLTHEIFQQE